MATNWKKVVKQQLIEKGAPAEAAAPGNSIDFKQLQTVSPDINQLAESNETFKTLLAERKTLEEKLDQVIKPGSAGKSANQKYENEIPTFGERKKSTEKWLESRQDTIIKLREKSSAADQWLTKKEGQKSSAVAKLTLQKEKAEDYYKRLDAIKNKIKEKTNPSDLGSIAKAKEKFKTKIDVPESKLSKRVKEVEETISQPLKQKPDWEKLLRKPAGDKKENDSRKPLTSLREQIKDRLPKLKDSLQKVRKKETEVLSVRDKFKKKIDPLLKPDLKKEIESKANELRELAKDTNLFERESSRKNDTDDLDTRKVKKKEDDREPNERRPSESKEDDYPEERNKKNEDDDLDNRRKMSAKDNESGSKDKEADRFDDTGSSAPKKDSGTETGADAKKANEKKEQKQQELRKEQRRQEREETTRRERREQRKQEQKKDKYS